MNEQAWKEQAARIIREHHRTLVRQPSRTNQPRKTFHNGEYEAAAALYPLVQQAIAAERERCTSNLQKTQIAPPALTEAQIRADERERCAAWLREDEQGRFVEGPEIEETFYNRDDYTGEECTWTEKRKPRRLRTRFDFAEAIERGEHAAIRSLKEADNGAGNECICPKCGLRHGGKVDSGAVF